MRPRLSMRAWTQRATAAGDAWGHQGTYTDVLTEAPCYWWVSSGGEQVDPQRTVAVGQEAVLFDRLADVAPRDRIRRLVDHLGRVIFDQADESGAYREVEHVTVERTHVAASLRSSS